MDSENSGPQQHGVNPANLLPHNLNAGVQQQASHPTQSPSSAAGAYNAGGSPHTTTLPNAGHVRLPNKNFAASQDTLSGLSVGNSVYVPQMQTNGDNGHGMFCCSVC